MSKKPAQARPTREQLAALSAKVSDAPAIGNDAQARLWAEIGSANGWAAMTPAAKAEFRTRFNAAA